MEIYKGPILSAILLFPFVAFIVTIPYMLIQYRKYGSIPILRSIIIYSFVLYLMCAYFLVILPLPTFAEVLNYTTPNTQLVPFQFVTDMISESNFVISDFSTYREIFFNPAIYQVLYNIILVVPFGFYLRYYFKCSFSKTVLYSFLLSLFFELTQLSGLYGIYPRSYRLFDVDDLFINTVGGMIGYLITPLCYFFVPSKEKLDEKSLEKGKKVSYIRRLFAFFIDLIMFLFLINFFHFFIANDSILNFKYFGLSFSYVISFLIYFVFLPTFLHGSTFGNRFLRLRVETIDGTNIMWENYLIRYGLLYIFFLPSIYYFFEIIHITIECNVFLNLLILIIALFLIITYVYFWLHVFISIFRRKRILCYEKLSNTKLVSTISVDSFEKDKTID